MGRSRRVHAHAAVTHVILIDLVQCRKEERNVRLRLQQTVTQDETVLALQRKLEEKQLERRRLKQSESKKVKTSEWTAAHTVRNTEAHNRVSETPSSLCQTVMLLVWLLTPLSCFLFYQKSLNERSWEELKLGLERHVQKAAPYVVLPTESLNMLQGPLNVQF